MKWTNAKVLMLVLYVEWLNFLIGNLIFNPYCQDQNSFWSNLLFFTEITFVMNLGSIFIWIIENWNKSE